MFHLVLLRVTGGCWSQSQGGGGEGPTWWTVHQSICSCPKTNSLLMVCNFPSVNNGLVSEYHQNLGPNFYLFNFHLHTDTDTSPRWQIVQFSMCLCHNGSWVQWETCGTATEMGLFSSVFVLSIWQRSPATPRTSLLYAGSSSGWRTELCSSTSITRTAAWVSLNPPKTPPKTRQRRSCASCTSQSWWGKKIDMIIFFFFY